MNQILHQKKPIAPRPGHSAGKGTIVNRKRIRASAAVVAFLLLIAALSGCTDTEKSDITIQIVDGEAVVTKYSDQSTVTEVVIPDEYEGHPVTKVADFGAVNLESVTRVVIGKNVREIESWAFTNNPKLEAFEVSDENQFFCDIDGVLYSKDQKTLLFYPISRDVRTQTVTGQNGSDEQIPYAEYTVPQGVETIRSKAFYKCAALTKVVLPNSIKRIEEMAFHKCSSLREFSLPQGLEFIGKDAFAYCSGLEKLTIPASVRQIDEYAFYNCTSLLDITVMKAESELAQGKKWFSTDNGKTIDKLKLTWKG